MPTTTTDSNDYGQVEYGGDAVFEDRVLTITGPRTIAANTHVKAGTLVARSVANPAKFIIYVKGGAADGNGIVAGVVTYPVEKASAGAGDVPVRVMVKGTVNRRRLVIDANGDASAVDGVVLDLMRARGIVTEDVVQANG